MECEQRSCDFLFLFLSFILSPIQIVCLNLIISQINTSNYVKVKLSQIIKLIQSKFDQLASNLYSLIQMQYHRNLKTGRAVRKKILLLALAPALAKGIRKLTKNLEFNKIQNKNAKTDFLVCCVATHLHLLQVLHDQLYME